MEWERAAREAGAPVRAGLGHGWRGSDERREAPNPFLFCSRCGIPAAMVRFGVDQLRDRALAALEEVCEECRAGPVRRSMTLRFTLAFLANFARFERWPFDHFWRAVTQERDIGRWQNANASLNAIYRVLEVKRADPGDPPLLPHREAR